MTTNLRSTPRSIQWWLYWRLPTLWWWGVKVKKIAEDDCTVTMRQTWFNQNPFRSAYFAALCGAGELSTGILVRQKIATHDMSMLLTAIEARFMKKATGVTTFTCTEGKTIEQQVQTATEKKEGVVFQVQAKGINEEGALVADITITWSLRLR